MAVSYRNMVAFLSVAESSTFAEAAEKLHLTQPALSSAIKKMEEQLGGKLFSRSTRRVQLTPEGETLLPSARRLVNEWDDTFEEMQNLFAVRQGRLTIAAMPSFAESRLPTLLKAYHAAYPNIRLRIMDVVMEDTIDAVLAGRAEIGFTFEPENTEGLTFTPLFDDAFVAVLYPEHPLASEQTISFEALLQSPVIAMNRGSAVRKWTEQISHRYGALNIVAETGQLGSVGQLIAQGLGVSVVPQLCQAQMQRNGLVCVALRNAPLVKRVGMIRADRQSFSVAAQALWEQCHATCL
ncbi:LysR family transcriptional regulator [Salinimonas sp. HHU 13199]|uniref:LysR family transcriptional regulator n=1 Tax=Salinimonas profundi TaxID=2729140 RepID=A0ABR8LJN8_9ALTE|nr:LysR family transcriptional regulator [Salinimonas profundi]MBD3584517.1 LysR family transcriptional regulator [Salinimonas profundi]